MPSSPTILENMWQSYLDETDDSRSRKLDFIKKLNRLLFRMAVTKPAEVISKIYYVDGFEKYQMPSNMRSPIGIYCESVELIRYVSPQRYRWHEPEIAFTDQGNSGQRSLMVRNPQTNSTSQIVTNCDNLTADGAWSISGGLNLAIDTVTKNKGAGSLTFAVSSASCALQFTRSSAVDISTMTEKMRMRFFAWFPTALTMPSEIVVKIGNDSSNYFSQTITTQADGQRFASDGYNEIEFKLESSTETGTVDRTAIDFVEITFNFSASVTQAGFKINYIVFAKPEEMEFEHYTNCVAIDSSGNFIQSITEDENTTDEPIIKDYPDYVNTVLDGLCYDFFKITDPTRAASFYTRFIGESKDQVYLGGMMYLRKQYPPRQATYKRVRVLPSLGGDTRSGIYTTLK